MSKRTHSVIALAAASLLGGSVLVMGQNAVDQNNPPAEKGVRMNVDAGTPGQQAANRAENVDQQILSQLRQFAQDPATAPDKMFLLNAAVDSMCEIQLSQQAAQHAQSEQVKTLAQRMIEDHTKLDQKAMPVAQAIGVQLPDGIPEMRQAEISDYAALPPKTFDEQFLAHMNAAHDKAIACFEAASSLSQNAQLKQFATDALPTLRMHREMVRQTAATLGINLGTAEAAPASAKIPGSHGNQMDTGGGSSTGTNAAGTATPGTAGEAGAAH